MIVTIDGPAGAGKSTVARLLAGELGFAYLDTGAMYRAMTYAAMLSGVKLEEPERLLEVCESAPLWFGLRDVQLDGKDISEQIRQQEVSRNVKFVADHPAIRRLLVDRQRELAANEDIVCEGRDQGTVAFPNADVKFFLTATPEERARRRVAELQRKGIETDYETVKQDQDRRDHQDSLRPVGALVKAPDACEFMTDGLTVDEVVTSLKEKIVSRESKK